MAIISDQIGQLFDIARPPRRVVSLVPSQTELLASLGLSEQVVGITKFCVHGGFDRKKLAIGGTKNPNIEKIKRLNPDFIIANKEENRQEDVEALSEFCEVWVSDVKNLQDNYQLISAIGTIFDKKAEAEQLSQQIQANFARLQPMLANQTPPKVAYLIWQQPFMGAGGDTFISEMLRVAGFEPVFYQQKRYPVLTEEDIASSGAEYLLLSTEPYPFSGAHLAEFSQKFPKIRPVLVDGEMFSWYGSRILHAADYFIQLRANLAL